MKETIRIELRRHLAAMKDGRRQEFSARACRHLLSLPEYRQASTIMAYIPLPDELDITSLLQKAWEDGKVITTPRIVWQRHQLIPIVTRNLDDELIPTRHGLQEPAGSQELPLEKLDLLIVPALGFDRRGHRMGRGGGFYDRFLARPELRARTVGITFAQQILPQLPVLSHDQAVQMIVTDAGIQRCN